VQLEKTGCGTEVSQQPDQALFERAVSVVEESRFDVAHMALQTLVNTYPNSEYADKAKLLLKDPRIAECGESENFSSRCGGTAHSSELSQ